MTRLSRSDIRIQVVSDLENDRLAVELERGEALLFEIYRSSAELILRIFSEYGKPSVEINALLFQQALKDAPDDAATILDGS